MDLAVFGVCVSRSWWRRWDLYSVWEARLRAREANELFSQNEIAGRQTVFPPFIFQKVWTMMKCFCGLGEILTEIQYFAWCQPVLQMVGSLHLMISSSLFILLQHWFFYLSFLPFILHFIVNTCWNLLFFFFARVLQMWRINHREQRINLTNEQPGNIKI